MAVSQIAAIKASLLAISAMNKVKHLDIQASIVSSSYYVDYTGHFASSCRNEGTSKYGGGGGGPSKRGRGNSKRGGRGQGSSEQGGDVKRGRVRNGRGGKGKGRQAVGYFEAPDDGDEEENFVMDYSFEEEEN